VNLSEEVCHFVTKAVNQARSEGKNVMLELSDVLVPGNFICARPDSTVFIFDTTQVIPQVNQLQVCG
jgi:hypothetical protein